MSYQERLPPEGINASRENPLKEFALLLGGLVLLAALLVSMAALFAEQLASYIPFDVELSVAGPYTGDETDTPSAAERYLAQLTDELAAASELPEGMTITPHYSDGDTVNAFATLGGHIVIYRGLVEKMPSENALAMVVAHEIAHIKHRDPITSLSRGVLVQLVLAAIAGGDTGFVLGKGGMLTLLTFNREMEEDADEQALRTLNNYYGHVAGAAALFEVLHDEGAEALPEFFSTHPLDASRIEHLDALARREGWPMRGELTPLPAGIAEPAADDAP